MKAVSFYFDYDDGRYKRLSKVLLKSWKQHNDIPLKIYRVPPNPKYAGDTHQNGLWRNHIKLKKWVNCVNQDTILLDCDMLCTGDMSTGFDEVEHIGFTKRDWDYPINGGVVYVRNTKESQEFLKKWYIIDEWMLNNPAFHDIYKAKYAGINQASMGFLLENGWAHLIKMLPCVTYNLCQPWDNWEQAKMIHIKSKLREECLGLGGRVPNTNRRPIVNLWRATENPQHTPLPFTDIKEPDIKEPDIDIKIKSKYKIAGVHFDYKNEKQIWDLMKKGFVNSVNANTSAELDLRILPSPEVPEKKKAKKKFVVNNHKLKEWCDIVYQSDCPVVLMDTDIIVLDDIDEAFSEHITLTERGHKWFNGGVVFVNPTEQSKKFFDAWVTMDERLFNNPDLRKKQTKKHGVLGQNQVALRSLYSKWPGLFSWVSCKKYNACEDNYWKDHEQNEAKVIHVKSSLQKSVCKYFDARKSKRKKHHPLLDKILPYYED